MEWGGVGLLCSDARLHQTHWVPVVLFGSAPSLFLQLVIMSATVLLAYYMECTNLFSVHVQGFFCNDAELMKPYPGAQESSFVPPLVLYCVVAAVPSAVVSTDEVM